VVVQLLQQGLEGFSVTLDKISSDCMGERSGQLCCTGKGK
jgi:hypothetical protein